MLRRNMKNSILLSCSCAIVALIVLLRTSPTTSQELENEKDFDYNPQSRIGPEKWGYLNESWTICNDGKKQSPIDVNFKNVLPDQSMGGLMIKYNISEATMKNRGHDIMVKWINGGGSFIINDKNYVLGQCHWHSPSEHTFNGYRYPLEMHMVHTSSDGDIAVTGILYTFGPPDPFLSPKLMKYLRYLVDSKKDEVQVGLVPPPMMEMDIPYYRYSGSLTTPPCTEGVVWSLVEEVKTVSKEQIDLLRAAVHNENNARPIQPTNGRTVYLYRPWNHEDHMRT